MPEKQTLIYAGVGVVAVAAAIAAIVVVSKKKGDNPLTTAKGKLMRWAVGASAMPARGVDYDATASMWADEDAIYHKAAALDKQRY